MTPPRVSLAVCTVTYESAHVVGAALRSVRASAEAAGVDTRLVAVDNASSDGSAGAVEAAWPGATVLRNDRNAGYAAAMNRAIAEAGTGHGWLLLLNPDVVVEPGTIPLLPHVDAGGDIQVFTPMFVDGRGRPARTAFRWPTLAKELARLSGALAAADALGRPAPALPDGDRRRLPEPLGEGIVVDYPVGACLFVRAPAWAAVGPFDEAFTLYHEEMEWCWRARALGIRPWVLPRARAAHAGKGSSARRPPEALLWQYRGLLHFYAKHRSPARLAVLRAAMAASFGARAAAAGVTRRPSARGLGAISRLALRPVPRADR